MVEDKLKHIRLLLLDVDGVLTTGEIIYDHQGEELKIFNVKDGLGLRLLMKAGIQVGIVTGRSAPALLHRCKNLNIDMVFDGIRDKAAVLEQIGTRTGVAPEHTAFIGDDLPDLPLMRRCGLSVAVADAHERVKSTAHMVTRAKGGRGAVRELCEAILNARDLWEPLMQELF